MKNTLIIAYLLGLISFFVLNFLFFVIGFAIEELIQFQLNNIADHPTYIICRLVYPFGFFPWELSDRFLNFPNLGFQILYFGYIVSFIITSVIIGLIGADIKKAVGGWILTAITSIFLFIIIFLIDKFNYEYYCIACNLNEAIVNVLIHGIVSLLIFGTIVIVIALLKMR